MHDSPQSSPQKPVASLFLLRIMSQQQAAFCSQLQLLFLAALGVTRADNAEIRVQCSPVAVQQQQRLDQGPTAFPRTMQGFCWMPCRPPPARRPTSPYNLILPLSSTSALAVIHITPPGIPIPLFLLPTPPRPENMTQVCYGSVYLQSLS